MPSPRPPRPAPSAPAGRAHRRRLALVGLAAILLLGPPLAARAATLCVPGTLSGRSCDATHGTIQAALDAASSGDTVWVGPGSYAERLDFEGKALALRSTAGRGSTVLDAEGAGTAVLMTKGEPAGTLFEGFSVRNGQGDPTTETFRGAGIACAGCAATVRGNEFRDGRGARGGGLSITQGASPVVTGNIFVGNEVTESGGAIALLDSDAAITNNVFRANVAAGGPLTNLDGPEGGALYVNNAGRAGPSIAIRGNSFESSRAEHGGAGLFLIRTTATVEDNAFVGGRARFGGGIHVEKAAGDVDVVGNSFFGNRARNQRSGDAERPLGGAIGIFRSPFETSGRVLLQGNRFVRNRTIGPDCQSGANQAGCSFGAAVGQFNSVVRTEGNLFALNRGEFGGAMWIDRPDATEPSEAFFAGNRVVENTAFSRPGISCRKGSLCEFEGNTVVGNTLRPGSPSLPGGGGLDFQEGATGFAVNHFVARNEGVEGGGLNVNASDLDVVNNTFVGNLARSVAGGVFVSANGSSMSAETSNNVFASNEDVGLQRNGDPGGAVVSNLFFDSDVALYRDDGSTDGSATELNGRGHASDNSEGDPRTRQAGLCDDYHVGPASAAREAGSGSVPSAPAEDADGEPRPLASTYDVGADEFNEALPAMHCPRVHEMGFWVPSENLFVFDEAGDGGSAERTLRFGGGEGNRPLTGDWDSDGRTDVGFYEPATGTFRLDTDGGGAAEIVRRFGNDPTFSPLVGDWNGDATIDVGLYDPDRNLFFLDFDGGGAAERIFRFGGDPGVTPLVGDWDGDGRDDVGFFRPGDRRFFLDLTRGGGAELQLAFGAPGDEAIVGDWNGDGVDEVGVYRPSEALHILSIDGAGRGDRYLRFGPASSGNVPITGNWRD